MVLKEPVNNNIIYINLGAIIYISASLRCDSFTTCMRPLVVFGKLPFRPEMMMNHK